MALPRLHTLFYRQRVFTYDEARQTLNLKASSLQKMLHELQRDGYILRIKKKIYAVIPIEASGRSFTPNKYLVAAKLQTKFYLSYHTALELHGVAESSHSTTYISVPRQAKPFQFQGTTYSFVTKYDSFGQTNIDVDGIRLGITDREKTILDGLERLKYVGGLEEYLKSVASFPSVDTSKLTHYLKLSKKKGLYAKVGWLLSLFAKEWFIKQSVLDDLRKHLGKRTFYLDHRNGKVSYRFDSTWNLMVPEHVTSLIEETPA
ncbi:MAG: hypothetical protein Q8P51_15220 [Ignavibacteria bacterium]|nr:hypothetical protein [Ignavibacteria bacterium]